MNIETVRGPNAHALLGDEAFRAQWTALWEKCPWATAFQTPQFACAWYETYRTCFDPCLLISRDEDCQLAALFLLAISEHGDTVNAGAHQAEYHAWICGPELGDRFIIESLRKIRRDISGSGLKFRYLPRNAPTAWLNDPEARRLCLHNPVPRPIMRFGDGKEIDASLRKSGNKSKLRALGKMGEVEFKRITDPAEFEAVFDSIIHCYDSRRMAINGSAPFANDRLKRAFHLAMVKSPELLHVTVLKVGGQIASAQLNSIGRKEVHISLITHSPAFARHSPGKFHILMLAKMLKGAGFEQLDLTPGGDTYKERFANDWDEVHRVSCFPNSFARRKAIVRESLGESARKVLKRYDITTADAKKFMIGLKQVGLASVPTLLMRKFGKERSVGEKRVYCFDAARAGAIDVPKVMRRNALDDLLKYRGNGTGIPRQEFLSMALGRIEEGHHIYTFVEGNELLHFGWLAERPTEEMLAQLQCKCAASNNSAIVLDLYTVPSARGRGLGALSLKTMLRDAAGVPGTEHTFIAIPVRNEPAKRVVEKVGFVRNP